MRRWLSALSAFPLSLPLAFEPAPEPGSFVVRHGAARVEVACSGIDVSGAPGEKPLRLRFEGASPAARAIASEPLPGRVHHLIGRDPSRWRRHLPLHARLTCAGVRPGLDLALYGRGGDLEFDVIAAPGADLGAFALAVEGADEAALTPAGDLALRAGARPLVLRRPVAYQARGGERLPVASRFVSRGPARLGLAVGAHDAALPLVIDPVLELSSYAGGNRFDTARAVAVDGDGFVLVAGTTDSHDFPVTAGAFQEVYAGGNGNVDRGDAFVMKLAPGGASLVWATYLGGDDADSAEATAVGPDGDVFVSGATWSKDLPVTPGAFQPERGKSSFDGWVARLAPAGDALVYATYLGGKDADSALALAVDDANRATVGGYTFAKDFPLTAGAFQTERRGSQDGFVTRLAGDGMSLVWSSLLGGKTVDAVYGVALAADGGAVVTGGTQANDFPVGPTAFQPKYADEGDAFVSRFAPDGMSLAWSSYLGGKTGNPFAFDLTSGVALDAFENVYVVGQTLSRDFPVSPTGFDTACGKNGDCTATDAFAVKLSADACALLYGTYLGDADVDAARGVDVDERGHAHVTGFTRDKDYPVTVDAHQPEKQGGADAFLTELGANGGRLVNSTFLGSNDDDAGNGVALGGALRSHLAGSTTGNDFPIAGSAFQPSYGTSTDGFVAVFGGVPAVEAALLAGLALDSSEGAVGAVASGELSVRNAGSAAANNVMATVTFDPAFNFNSSSASQGSCAFAASILSCNLGTLAPGATATIDLGATPTTGGVLAWRAVASADATDPVGAAACLAAETHDLAVISLKAPKSVKIAAGEPEIAKVTVEIENQSNHTEPVADASVLADLVTLLVTPTGGACPMPSSGPPTAKLPAEIAPGKKLKVSFEVALDCADTDYTLEARVDHVAIDGLPDSDPSDDVLGGVVIDAVPR